MQLAPLYPQLYKILKPSFPDCLWSGKGDRKVVALTFDDGPHSQYTPQLLEVLDQHQAIANFFWLGCCVERSPQIASEIYQRGDWVGIHGYDHTSFPWLTADALQQSLAKTQIAIAEACNLDPKDIRDVRPPNGLFTPRTLTLLRQWQYRPVMWSVVPEDWVRPGIDVVVNRVMHQVANGSIIVLHDGAHGGQDVAATVAQLLPLLQAQGYEFVTIEQLWRGTYAQAG
ncbi:polysaccharide deacetylase family protein [Tumidithrix helvetica]|uniref:polysaccharide deacetylase family protein n=1 Tax=Tumidithrix helvetica TaxID=3457545 RepID=UPI003CC5F132